MAKSKKLKEWKNLYQRPKERRRRCFSNEHFELYLWYEPDGSIHHVQLLYSLEGEELHALRWSQKRGLHHHSVEGGEGDGFQYDMGRSFGAPLQKFDKKNVLSTFKKDSQGMEPEIRAFIIKLVTSWAQK